MLDELKKLKIDIEKAVQKAPSLDALERLEIKYLGRKGDLTRLLKSLSRLSAKERPKAGKLANEIKLASARLFDLKRRELSDVGLSRLELKERVDVTEPGLRPPEGHLHITTQAIREIALVFEKIGFTRARYPEIDWDYYAFESLNMPPDHPARDEWETFFIDAPQSAKGRMVLTPHTSNSQVRELERGELPVRMINIAKCYRRQSDVTHVPMFHQFEGLYVDKEVAISHLRGVLDYFAREFFGLDRAIRLRPFHFRFTEPSFEIDVSCGVCGGTGVSPDKGVCRVCKQGWLELGGAGMVHPNVLKAGGVDTKKYSGFAFGWGVERSFMMKEGLRIDDIRLLYKNDLRFLKQF